MTTFFKPSDIRTIAAVVNNITRSGAAFAVAESGEQVFIPVRMVDQNRLDIGDGVTCYAIDMHLDERINDDPAKARYRAIRLRVDVRLGDVLPASAIGADIPIPAPAPASKPVLTPEEVRDRMVEMLKQGRCWTVTQMSQQMAEECKDSHIIPDDLRQKIGGVLAVSHDNGKIACCKIMSSGDAKAASVVYYAKSVKIFESLLDDYEVEDE